MPKVSVILPTYNCRGYLQDSVSSVLSQTFGDIELLVVDDGSADGTEEFIRGNFRDPRLTYLKTPHRGLSSARNKGIESAHGELVSFIDADDIYEKDKIERQAAAFRNKALKALYCAERYFYEDDKSALYDSTHAKFSGDVFVFLKRANFIHVSTVMLRRSAIKRFRFDPELKSHEDWDYFLKLSSVGIHFVYMKEPLTMVRVRGSSMTAVNPVMESSRRIVGSRAKKAWKALKKGGLAGFIRYAVLKTRAFLINFPRAHRFNKRPLSKTPRIFFGSSVHESFRSFLDLYRGVRRFFVHPVYIYASNEGLGRPSEGLVRIPAKRHYKWRRSHNFLFDAVEYLEGKSYDYLVALDSDCLVNNAGLLDFLSEEPFDFVIYPNLNGLGGWYHGNVFRENINSYENILKACGLKRRDDRIVGNFNPLIVLSKNSCDFLRENLSKIESSDGYKKLMSLDFSVGETLIFNILKDAGFRPKFITHNLKQGIRYRPYWEAEEYRRDIPIYHPVRRKAKDAFRRLVGIKAGYDRNYIFVIPVFFYTLYRKIVPNKPGKGEGWFNP